MKDICSGSVQLLFIPCIHPMHNSISLNIIKSINSKQHQWKCMYIHMVQVVSSFVNKLLQEYFEITGIIILITLFWSRNTSVTLLEFPKKIISY